MKKKKRDSSLKENQHFSVFTTEFFDLILKFELLKEFVTDIPSRIYKFEFDRRGR